MTPDGISQLIEEELATTALKPVRKLGTGTSATAYEAVDEDGDHYVVKLAHGTGDSLGWERERHALELMYPDLFAGAGLTALDRPYIITEYLDGQTADKLKGTPVGEVLPVIEGVLGELAELHAKGYTHSDVKPANVFVTEDGGVRLLDFGLAWPVPSPQLLRDLARARVAATLAEVRWLDEPTSSLPLSAQTERYETYRQTHAKLSRLREQLGSPGDPRYMPPGDEFGGMSYSSVPTDIFSVGATAYDLLTGKPPGFRCDLDLEVEAPYLPPLIAAVIEKALACDPSERYQSAGEMLSALKEAV